MVFPPPEPQSDPPASSPDAASCAASTTPNPPPCPLPIGLDTQTKAQTESGADTPRREIIFFGGSFDPPHRAHTRLASLARELGADSDAWLLFVPAARSPFKTTSPTPARDRLAMLELAVRPLPRAVIWTDELDRAKPDSSAPSYWIDTLVRAQSVLKARFDPLPPLRFLLGSDQAVAFDRWHRAGDILALASPIVMLRPPLNTPDALLLALAQTKAWSSAELARWQDWIVPTPIEPISATEIRSLLDAFRAGRCGSEQTRTADIQPCVRTQLTAMLDPSVLAYIIEHDLYCEHA